MKFKRQAAILDIISNNEIKTQEELSAHLRERGYNATQATISRDMKELRLIKVASHSGGYQYSTPDQSGSVTHMTRLKNIFRECVVKVDRAQNLVVLKTLVGMANAAAAAIGVHMLPLDEAGHSSLSAFMYYPLHCFLAFVSI